MHSPETGREEMSPDGSREGHFELGRARHRTGPSVPSQSPAQGGRGRAGRTPANPSASHSQAARSGDVWAWWAGVRESVWEKGRVRR